jgi:hypothetical protein
MRAVSSNGRSPDYSFVVDDAGAEVAGVEADSGFEALSVVLASAAGADEVSPEPPLFFDLDA